MGLGRWYSCQESTLFLEWRRLVPSVHIASGDSFISFLKDPVPLTSKSLLSCAHTLLPHIPTPQHKSLGMNKKINLSDESETQLHA